ncbi:ABC transporter ATP-binding protein [Candidatus Kinetoplastidibacterium crithidiae]|uniref:Subfamily B ATP-binding cassette n=1 Tax=Candidatus Kinetoplastidibacterium crithidiae TCC036E TaxID=1208918 RepID=M1LXE7_9PROT|nr:ABC transporter ATP-binding protein [Candidatus Kinetoplastibacterium crithidii]AFZ82878.1 ATP-binding cassette, subfamily B, bacterial [Candidatus Kinetoplastibacterium crithidii (ex Angomonas deanei ATCC 30255)]AGF47879.1 subfamily B ATP-binding cassette [Candidatus Kinetoplastibacterium crithidii TCC036E]
MSDEKSCFSYFENLIDPFRETPDIPPPYKVSSFFYYYLKQIKTILIILLFIGLGVSLVEIALFKYVANIIDLAQSSNPEKIFGMHYKELLVMMIVILVCRPIIFALHDLLIQQTITSNMAALIRWQNHKYILKQSISFFYNDFAGRISNRVIQTGAALRDSAIQAIEAIWHVVVYTSSAIFIFSQTDWHLIFPLLIWIVVYVFFLVHYIPLIQKRSTISSETRSKLIGLIVDTYSNIITIKLFSHTKQEEEYAKKTMTEQIKTHQLALRLITEIDTALTAINGLLIVSTAGIALWLWSKNIISLGSITLAISLVIRINNMSSWLMWVVKNIFENVGVVQDSIGTISQSREIEDFDNSKTLKITNGEIKFDSVFFAYEKKHEVITNLTLTIKSKEKIAIVGPSGAGKSTLIHLLLRLHDVENGSICIDGQNIKYVTQDSLRSQISVVTQDVSLLHRSIRDNLVCGANNVSEEQLKNVIKKTKLDFIDSITDTNGNTGLDAHVGERGIKLSGGQKQRIAIARALLKNSPIIILDEATSALDSETESIIQQNLEDMMIGKTVITIAHRLSTILKMDRIIIVSKGTIVDSGTHGELISKAGIYQTLWDKQSRYLTK